MYLLLLQDRKQSKEKKNDTAINKKKIIDIYNNKYIKTENECADNSNNDSCEDDKKTAELQTEK